MERERERNFELELNRQEREKERKLKFELEKLKLHHTTEHSSIRAEFDVAKNIRLVPTICRQIFPFI